MNDTKTTNNKTFQKILYTCVASIFAMTTIFAQTAYASKNLDILFSNTTDPFFIDLERKFIEDMEALNIHEEDLGDLDIDIEDFDTHTHVDSAQEQTEEQIVEQKVTGYFRTYVSSLLGQAQKNTSLQNSISNFAANIEIEKISEDLSNTSAVLEELGTKVDEKDLVRKEKLVKLQLTRREIEKKEVYIKNLTALSEETLEDMYTYAYKLKNTKSDLTINKENYSEHLESLYMMQIDIFTLEGRVDDIKILSKYDSLAMTLAQQHVSETLQHSLADLIELIQTQETEIMETLLLLDQKKDEYNTQSAEVVQQQKEYKEQVEDFQEQIQEIQEDIANLETQVSISEEKSATLQDLIDQHKSQTGSKDYSKYFAFPVEGGISRLTSFFIDQGYVNLFGFAHYAIDIPRPQGAPTLAPAPGYVYKVFEQESSALNWFIVVHEGGLSSVFLHMYSIDVQEGDYVEQGQQIGRSGGAPGTKGAGFHTTGPHLHREVWKDREIVDPLLYTDLSTVTSSSVLQGQYSSKWKTDQEPEPEPIQEVEVEHIEHEHHLDQEGHEAA